MQLRQKTTPETISAFDKDAELHRTLMAIQLGMARMNAPYVPYDPHHLVDLHKKSGPNDPSLSWQQVTDRPIYITSFIVNYPQNSGGATLTVGSGIPLQPGEWWASGLGMLIYPNQPVTLTTPNNTTGTYYVRIMGFAMKETGWMVDR